MQSGCDAIKTQPTEILVWTKTLNIFCDVLHYQLPPPNSH